MKREIRLGSRAVVLVKGVRERIVDQGMCCRHRKGVRDFTRERMLTFPVMILVLLQKSLKSLQTHMHEFMWQLKEGMKESRLSGGALTHARAKLGASAFIELNQSTVLATVYGPAYGDLVERWFGHRLLSVDSSLMRLPKSQEVGAAFGWVQCSNHCGLQERYPQGRISVLYDVLNQVALEASLAPWKKAETELAHSHLHGVKPGDVVLTDRGYTGYLWLVGVVARGGHFVSRCSRGSFAEVQQLFVRNQAGVSKTVILIAPKQVREECRQHGWPLQLKVRLVTIQLSTGELEVLVTSLLDEAAYPIEELACVYWQRWGHETFYARLKGRLDLEHCSGQTVNAVEQDFHATVFLSNVESVIMAPAQAQLSARTCA